MYKITIKNKDIKEDRTDSGRLIDKMAMSIGQWTENDLFINNTEYEHESFDYIYEHFDFEMAFLTWLNKMTTKQIKEYLKKDEVYHGDDIIKDYKKQKLLFGAYFALNYPVNYKVELQAFEEELEEERSEYYESEKMEEKAPELKKELEESVDDFQKRNYKEWLYGDNSNFRGIIFEFKKKIEADSVEYNEKEDELYIEIDETADLDFYYNNSLDDERRFTKKEMKDLIVDTITNGMIGHDEKQQAERKKRSEEYTRVRNYKEEQAKEAEKERREKLLAMKK